MVLDLEANTVCAESIAHFEKKFAVLLRFFKTEWKHILMLFYTFQSSLMMWRRYNGQICQFININQWANILVKYKKLKKSLCTKIAIDTRKTKNRIKQLNESQSFGPTNKIGTKKNQKIFFLG